MVIQAEELLLLKLIQFSRNFITDLQAATAPTSTEDAKALDYLSRGIVEAEGINSR